MNKEEFLEKFCKKGGFVYLENKGLIDFVWQWIEQYGKQQRIDELEYIRDTAPEDETHLIKRLNQRIEELKDE